eukprot:Sdes_comp20743_c0_seq3m16617
MFQNQSKNLGKHDFMKMTLPFSKSSNFEINKNSQQNVTVVQKKISTMDTSLIRKMNHKVGKLLNLLSCQISPSMIDCRFFLFNCIEICICGSSDRGKNRRGHF